MLFVCVHNAGRSQMAAGLVKLRSEGRIHVRSAGSAPARRSTRPSVEAMGEIGVDMSEEFPKPLTDEVVRAADVVITMGCGDACPIYPGKRYEDWELDDPAGQDLETVRRIRDEIDARVRELIAELLRRLSSAPARPRVLAAEASARSRSSSPAAARSWSTRRPASSATSASRSRFGLVIMAMIYAVGHISGAHFNPAVTFAFALSRHFPWPRAFAYWGAQLAGRARRRGALCAARSGTSPTSARRSRPARRPSRFSGSS